jgi:FAD/FMN-containing dehydrogenase
MEVMLSSGDVLTCGPNSNESLFRTIVGGVGMLGVIVSVTIQMRRVSSPLLHVEEFAAPDLTSMMSLFETRQHSADFLVGWVDGYADGDELGRGLVQIGNYLDVSGAFARSSVGKYVSDRMVDLVPHSLLWLLMKPVANDTGIRRINQARYVLGSLRTGMVRYLPQSGFQFFHDFAPNWNRAFHPIGIVQYQIFVPGAEARDVFAAALEETHAMDVHPFLVVLKLHRADRFLLSYGVDGYSLSLDFRMTGSNRDRLLSMLDKLTSKFVLPAGGRFYLAKDNTLSCEAASRSLGKEAVAEFLSTKHQFDPDNVFQSDLYRRLLQPAWEPQA